MPTIKTEHEFNPVTKPIHYNSSPATCECGRTIECIQVTEHMSFTLGNVVKYVWRTDWKAGLEDLEKALWYLQREIQKRRIQVDKAEGQYDLVPGSVVRVTGTLMAEQAGQLKGDFESFKEYVNEVSSHNIHSKDTKGR